MVVDISLPLYEMLSILPASKAISSGATAQLSAQCDSELSPKLANITSNTWGQYNAVFSLICGLKFIVLMTNFIDREDF